ncbi:hypothetical protein HAX54_012938, partial [Datura stramonium]|nr:hypothetical protein [Datura stramonium]
MNFHNNKTPHPQLEIVSDKGDSYTRILALEDKIDVLDSNKVFNTTAFLLKSSTHNEEASVTCPKVSEE